MRTVVDPGPARLDELAGRNHRGMPDQGDVVALASRFDPEHAEAVLRVAECNAVDEAGQNLGWGACPRGFWHRVMMQNKILGRSRERAGDDTWRARS